LIYVLVVSGVVTGLLGPYVDWVVIFGVVVVNAIVGYLQESTAQAELTSLRAMIEATTVVVPGGREHTVPSEAIVPGAPGGRSHGSSPPLPAWSRRGRRRSTCSSSSRRSTSSAVDR